MTIRAVRSANMITANDMNTTFRTPAGPIGITVRVIVDRPLGSHHPKYPDLCYSVNYGYVPGILAPDGEEQDVYILGVDEPLKEFVGTVIAVIHRFDDVEEKWVTAPTGVTFSKEEIARAVAFQEQYFQTEIRM